MEKTTADLVVAQVSQELLNSNWYLAISSRVNELYCPGFAAWFRQQSEEERRHAMKLFDHLNDRGVHCEIGTISATDVIVCDPKITTVLNIFKICLVMEQKNSMALSDIYFASLKGRDFLTSTFLLPLLDEQIEEERWCMDGISALELAGMDFAAILRIDADFGNRKG